MSDLGVLGLEVGDLLGVNLLNLGGDKYGIVDTTGSASVITPDSVISFEYRGEERISDYPIEQGGFASYNKVSMPYDIRMRVTCGGQNLYQSVAQVVDNIINSLLGTGFGQPMTRSDFLDTLERMKQSTDLYDIVTPDKTYASCNLVHYDYRRENNNGAKLIKADLWFQEVRETVSALYTSGSSILSDSASAANPIGSGSVTALVPSAAQQAIFSAGGFF